MSNLEFLRAKGASAFGLFMPSLGNPSRTAKEKEGKHEIA